MLVFWAGFAVDLCGLWTAGRTAFVIFIFIFLTWHVIHVTILCDLLACFLWTGWLPASYTSLLLFETWDSWDWVLGGWLSFAHMSYSHILYSSTHSFHQCLLTSLIIFAFLFLLCWFSSWFSSSFLKLLYFPTVPQCVAAACCLLCCWWPVHWCWWLIMMVNCLDSTSMIYKLPASDLLVILFTCFVLCVWIDMHACACLIDCCWLRTTYTCSDDSLN